VGQGFSSWEVIGHTRFTVKAAYGVEIDFTKFNSGDRVKVTGTQVTEERNEYKNLVIKADSVEVLSPSARVSAQIAETRQPGYASNLIVDAPF
jgi:hypothetical protein